MKSSFDLLNLPHTAQAGVVGVLCLIGMTSCASCVSVGPTMLNTEQSTHAAPSSTAPTSFAPQMAQVSQARPNVQPVQMGVSGPVQASFIVKFRDEPEVLDICRSYRRDTPNATARYYRWAAQHKALDALVLSSASYSGELILSLPKADPKQRSAEDVLDALQTLNNLAYAEMDSTAYPSLGDSQ